MDIKEKVIEGKLDAFYKKKCKPKYKENNMLLDEGNNPYDSKRR
jgi:hypothetical protein